MTLTCREARESDRAELARIFLACRRAGSHWLGVTSPALRDFDRATEGERLFVAEDGEHCVLGFVAVFEPERFVHHVFVKPGHERQGVGRRLLESLGDWLPLPYRLKCACANTRALAFYHALGWIEVGRDHDHTGKYVDLELNAACRVFRQDQGADGR